MNDINSYYPPMYPPAYPRYNPYKKILRSAANWVCLGSVSLFVVGLIVMPLLEFIAQSILSRETLMQWGSLIDAVIMLVAYVAMLLVPIIIVQKGTGIPSHIAFPTKAPRMAIAFPAIFFGLGASMVGVAISTTLSYMLERYFGIIPTMPDMPVPNGLTENVIYFVTIAIVPAVLEEVLFRGVIMQSLRRFGDVFALIVSAILFGFSHGNLIQGPNAILMGIVIGFFVLRTGSLLTGILIHFANNAGAVIIEFATKGMDTKQIELVGLAVFVFYSISGLVALVYFLFRHPKIFSLAPSSFPMDVGTKYRLFFTSAFAIIYVVIVAVVTILNFQ